MSKSLPIPPARRPRRGVTLIYVTVMMSVLLGMAVYAVDVGRMRLAKADLQDASDAAARYAVTGVVSSSTPATTSASQAKAVTGQWVIEGCRINDTDVTTTIGTWVSATKVFTPTSINPNAVKIDLVYRMTGAGRAPLFSSIFLPSQQPVVHASTIAFANSNATQYAPRASGNLWLSGATAGTVTQNFRADANWVWDTAGTTSTPKQSPLEMNLASAGFSAGQSLCFEGLSGTASWDTSGGAVNSADGDASFMVALGATYPPNVPTNNLNGIANVRAPIGAVMAVFLNDNAPNTSSAPSTCLDFQGASQRDYTTLSPGLKQPFFVGDGKRANGEIQKITIPAGATRVFIGMMDAWQWNDNVGIFNFKVYSTSTIIVVK